MYKLLTQNQLDKRIDAFMHRKLEGYSDLNRPLGKVVKSLEKDQQNDFYKPSPVEVKDNYLPTRRSLYLVSA